MPTKTLKSRIDELVSALGGPNPPGIPELKGLLIQLSRLAQSLDDGQPAPEREAHVGALEAENEKLKIEIRGAKVEIDAFRAENKKQEKKKWDLPTIQLEILKRLPSEQGSERPGIDSIASSAKIPIDEAEIHLDRLVMANLAMSGENSFGMRDYHRTIPGNELVFAMRLAGEKSEPVRKHADRTPTEEEVMQFLAMLGPRNCRDFEPDTPISVDRAEVALHDLKQAGLVKVTKPAGSGDEDEYDLSIEGVRYMLERGYLS